MCDKIGNIQNKLMKIIEKEDGNIINIFINVYDHLIQVGKMRKNNKLFIMKGGKNANKYIFKFVRRKEK